MSGVTLRQAVGGDATAIADIYNHYVAGSLATFDMVLKDGNERIIWLAEHDDKHPVLVAEDLGRVVAWGALSPYASRPGWRHTVEISIYVDPDEHGKGLGSMLMSELLEYAVRIGHHVVIGQIVAGNESSLALAISHGFKEIGRLREVGRKFDEWLDVVLVQRILNKD